jgi:hypothetical protein
LYYYFICCCGLKVYVWKCFRDCFSKVLCSCSVLTVVVSWFIPSIIVKKYWKNLPWVSDSLLHYHLSLLVVLFMLMEWDYVSEMWSPMGLSLISQMIYVYGVSQWNDIDRAKLKNSRERPVSLPLCSPQTPHGLTRVWTQASTLRGQRLTAWAMAQSIDGVFFL